MRQEGAHRPTEQQHASSSTLRRNIGLLAIVILAALVVGILSSITTSRAVTRPLESLTRDMLVRIMTEPKNSIYNQFLEIFKNEGVELKIEPKVFQQISEIAMEYKTGARSLRGIFEELINPLLFIVPDDATIQKVVVSSLFADAQIIRKLAAA